MYTMIIYMILLAMDELHMLGQHWQMAQAAEPKQLKREIWSERISVSQRFQAHFHLQEK